MSFEAIVKIFAAPRETSGQEGEFVGVDEAAAEDVEGDSLDGFEFCGGGRAL